MISVREKLVNVGSKISKMDDGLFILRTKRSFFRPARVISAGFMINELFIRRARANEINIATTMSQINEEYDAAGNRIMIDVED